jgi:type I restriction enzyme S subunit
VVQFSEATSTKKVKQKEYIENAPLAVVDQGVALIGGATDKFDLAFEGDLPVIVFGDHTRCVKLVDFPFVQGADGVKVLKPLSPLSTNLYSYALNTVQLPDRGYSRHFKFLKATEFPVPPLNEQRRIADKIDALQAKSRRAREALETVGPLLEKFRQSVLAAAFRGDLTAEWRKQHPDVEPAEKFLERIRAERRARWEEAELAKMRAKGIKPKSDKWKAKYNEPEPVDARELPELPEGWCWTNLGNLIHSIEAGKSPRASSTPATGNEKGVLKVSAVSWGEFNANENKRLQDDFQLEGIPTVQAGDLLISRANTVELVGAVVVAKADHPNLILSDKILRLNVASDSCPAGFLKFALRTKWVRDVFEDQATGTSNSMRNLSQGKIMSAPIPLPTEPEVEQIVQLLSKSEEGLKSQGQLVREGMNKITGLDQAILAKAFRGELVPQDLNDEPASMLLERIKAEREADKGKKKTSRSKK